MLKAADPTKQQSFDYSFANSSFWAKKALRLVLHHKPTERDTVNRAAKLQLVQDCFENALDMRTDPAFADVVDTDDKLWLEVRRQYEEEVSYRASRGHDDCDRPMTHAELYNVATETTNRLLITGMRGHEKELNVQFIRTALAACRRVRRGEVVTCHSLNWTTN